MKAPNKEMVILAREARELTQRALADAIEVTQGTVSKIEHGQIEASDEVILKIALCLGFPVEFFYQQLSINDLPPSFFRRRLTDVPQKTIKAVRARWALLLRGLALLMPAVDFPECRVPQIDLGALGIGPDEVARRIRRLWAVPVGPIQNMTTLVEQMGVMVIPFDFGSDRIDGMSIYDRSLDLPPVIFVNNKIPGDRQRFTTAHELGHIAMHTHRDSLNDHELEDQADIFASEFLLPTDQIIGHLQSLSIQTLLGLKVHWKASMASLLMKASSLDLISDWHRTNLWKQFSKRGWKTVEPSPLPREEPGLLRQLLTLHQRELGYSDEELCALLCNISRDDMVALYAAAKPPGLRLVQ